jgi:hypothetical protein
MKKKYFIVLGAIILLFLFILILNISKDSDVQIIDRESKLPNDVIKGTPENDVYPPILYSPEFENPMPLPYPIKTVGAEDSPFIPYNKDEFYFFFTPDTRIPVEKQLLDGVTGIYRSRQVNDLWQAPERVMLQQRGKLALDGCEFVEGNVMIFCSAREGYEGINWFSANLDKNSKWNFDKKIDFPKEWQVGELHEYNNQLYYGSLTQGGKGSQDIWMAERKEDGSWTNPVNIEAVNSPDNEGYPYISQDGSELWFSRTYMGTPAIFRSKKINSQWSDPEMIVAQFAGEPTLDKSGNLYFVHHYYRNNTMIEADIYVAMKK